MTLSNTSSIGDLSFERTFDAPVERVWKMWTDPVELMKWWGPKTFTAPIMKNDFRVGGKYHYCMRSPEGKDFWSTGIYKEIEPMKKIVCTDSFADAEGNVISAEEYGMKNFPLEMTIALTFEEVDGGKTKLTAVQGPHPVGKDRDMAMEGWNSMLDKLVEHL